MANKGGKSKKLLALLAVGAGAVAFAVSRRSKAGSFVTAGKPEERLLIKDEENISGLGSIMGSLISEFLKDPAKIKVLDTLNLVLSIEPIEQPDTAITMTFSNGYAIIEPGVVPNPDIKLICDFEVLMQLPQMGAGLDAVKYMASPDGKIIINKFMSGNLKIKGLMTHPFPMLKFAKFLAPSA
ncbi:MAG TPA: hypothetical protein VIK22_12295 [Candidatus Anoxymicrobiaceae bacterium]|jgi:hypothetical protein